MKDRKLIEFIKDIATEAGELSLCEFEKLSQNEIGFKNDKDLVTEADRKVENYLISKINERFPDHDIFGEETGHSGSDSKYCWVIDPIDGTTSFVHGQPFYSISVALQEDGKTIAGVVNAPRLGELFWAEKGLGAFCNEEKLQVSSRDRLLESVLATGFACIRADLPENNLKYFNRIMPDIRGIRRFGSAAIDLSYVAADRLDGFWEMNLKLYDIAAGCLILEEAGGRICDFNGGTEYPEYGLIATNGHIEKELLGYFGD